MAGVTVSGVLWAVFQNNAGGAWDNAKKSFEAGVMINGEMTYKGSDAHKAAVTGDTVGDPFKDTSGPSMNILIKLTCLIGLVIAPILGGHDATTITEKPGCCSETEMCASMTKEECIEKGCTNKNCKYMNENTKEISKNVSIEKSVNADGKVVASVSVSTTENGETKSDTITFEGTDEEVTAKIEAFKKQ
ncbi:sodium/proton-translocating pyrophosphatase [Flavobacterium piscinae]|nr:sodium/proton-translocating pyrophosphatase [Flavobacterium piscinae]